MEQMEDILVEIPDEHLARLAIFYEENASWAPYMVSFVQMGIKWKQSTKHGAAITFMSPNNSWEKDGTIISVISCSARDIVVFTIDDECTNLYRGLMETNLIDYHEKRTQFFGVHAKHLPAVRQFIQDKNLDLFLEESFYIYTFPDEVVKQFATDCPDEVHLKKLDRSAAHKINELWPHKFPGSVRYVAFYLKVNGGYGLFLKSTSEMIAWVLKYAFGHSGVLHVEENHRRKGYGSLLLKVLSRELYEEGHWSGGHILFGNEKSLAMVKKMGCRIVGTCTFFKLKWNGIDVCHKL